MTAARPLAAGAALWLTGCAGIATDVQPEFADLPQTFALESVNNRPVPALYAAAPDTLELLSVTLTLHPNSTYTSRRIERWSGPRGAHTDTLAFPGRFTRTDQGLVLRGDRTGHTTEFEITEGGDVLRGPGLPEFRTGIDIYILHVFRRVASAPL
jgi:hypothetical protein